MEGLETLFARIRVMSIRKNHQGSRQTLSAERAIRSYSNRIDRAYVEAMPDLLAALSALYSSIQMKLENIKTPNALQAVCYAEVRRYFRRSSTRRSGCRLAATCALAWSMHIEPSDFVEWVIDHGGIQGAAKRWSNSGEVRRARSARKQRIRTNRSTPSKQCERRSSWTRPSPSRMKVLPLRLARPTPARRANQAGSRRSRTSASAS